MNADKPFYKEQAMAKDERNPQTFAIIGAATPALAAGAGRPCHEP